MGSRAPVLTLLAALTLPAAAGSPEGLPAEVLALKDVRVPAEVAGRVLKRPEKENAAVRRGAVVVTLDDTFLRAAAEAARAAVQQAEAKRDWTKLELERVRALFDKQSVGQSDVDRALLAAREAAAGLLAVQALAREAETRLERSRITAPFDGKLVRVHPEAGEYLQVGQTAFRIVDDSRLRIVFYAPAHALEGLREGVELKLCADREGSKLPVLEAVVYSVAPAAEGRSRTFRVEARADDASGRWRPGMTGRVLLD
jgi:RND family efflux transporter MFP subunit